MSVVLLIDGAPFCLLGYKIPKLPKMFDFYVNANLNDYDSSGKKANVNDSFNTFLMKCELYLPIQWNSHINFNSFPYSIFIIKYLKIFYIF